MPEFTVSSTSASGVWERGTFGGVTEEYFYLRSIVLNSNGGAERVVINEAILYVDILNPCTRVGEINA